MNEKPTLRILPRNYVSLNGLNFEAVFYVQFAEYSRFVNLLEACAYKIDRKYVVFINETNFCKILKIKPKMLQSLVSQFIERKLLKPTDEVDKYEYFPKRITRRTEYTVFCEEKSYVFDKEPTDAELKEIIAKHTPNF